MKKPPTITITDIEEYRKITWVSYATNGNGLGLEMNLTRDLRVVSGTEVLWEGRSVCEAIDQFTARY